MVTPGVMALCLMLAACATSSPVSQVRASPGSGKSSEQFQKDAVACDKNAKSMQAMTRDQAVSMGVQWTQGGLAIIQDRYDTEYSECMTQMGNYAPYTSKNFPPIPHNNAGPPVVARGAPEPPPARVAFATSEPDRTKYKTALNGIVSEDSKAWHHNRYDAGSMADIETVSRSSNGKKVTIRGNYTFNQGERGWVEAEFENGALLCLRFWDFSNTCRPQFDIVKIRAEQKRQEALAAEARDREAAAWAALPEEEKTRILAEQKKAMCLSTCRSRASQCRSNTAENVVVGGAIGGFDGAIIGALFSKECGGVYSSCASSCP
jgi:hypothetical protein